MLFLKVQYLQIYSNLCKRHTEKLNSEKIDIKVSGGHEYLTV